MELDFDVCLAIQILEERISKLEKNLDNFIYITATKNVDHELNFTNLGNIIAEYHRLVLGACPIDIEKTIKENMRGKSPHKCPICEGERSIRIEPTYYVTKNPMDQRHLAPKIQECLSCEGKGIVWG